MHLGFCNASTNLQRTIDPVIFSVNCKLSLLYFDDTVIFGKTMEQDTEHARQNLSLLYSTITKLKLSWCS